MCPFLLLSPLTYHLPFLSVLRVCVLAVRFPCCGRAYRDGGGMGKSIVEEGDEEAMTEGRQNEGGGRERSNQEGGSRGRT